MIFEDSDQNIWLGTGAGLERFDADKGTFELFSPFPAKGKEQLENLVWAIEEDKAGNIWVGTDGGGLNLFDRHKNAYIRSYLEKKGDSTSLSSNRVISIHIDEV